MIKEIIAQWLPVIVSVVGSTAIGVVVKSLTKRLITGSEDKLNTIKRQATDTQATAISILDEVKLVKNDTEDALKKVEKMLAEVKQEKEDNKKILEDITKATEEMTSIRNELNAIKRQNTRDLRANRNEK